MLSEGYNVEKRNSIYVISSWMCQYGMVVAYALLIIISNPFKLYSMALLDFLDV